MTDQQSTQITNMRESGLGYSTIANQIGLSKGMRKILLQDSRTYGEEILLACG